MPNRAFKFEYMSADDFEELILDMPVDEKWNSSEAASFVEWWVRAGSISASFKMIFDAGA